MKISLDFRHPWSDIDHVAHIQREDLNGKQARRVLAAIEAERARLSLNSPNGLDISHVWNTLVADYNTPFPAWPNTTADDEENGRKWKALHKVHSALLAESRRLEKLYRRYEWRSYTEKELDDLTREEWDCVDPWELCLLSDFERKRYGV